MHILGILGCHFSSNDSIIFPELSFLKLAVLRTVEHKQNFSDITEVEAF